ncbi:MAG: TonB-dependent receptor, partial [Sphingobium sp.]
MPDHPPLAARLSLVGVALFPAASLCAQEREAQPPPIIVQGAVLDPPPGSTAYGETLIDGARLRSSSSGRVEDVLRDVAGFSQFRRSDSRSANPSAQGANL